MQWKLLLAFYPRKMTRGTLGGVMVVKDGVGASDRICIPIAGQVRLCQCEISRFS